MPNPVAIKETISETSESRRLVTLRGDEILIKYSLTLPARVAHMKFQDGLFVTEPSR
jgi:hypothetical protein